MYVRRGVIKVNVIFKVFKQILVILKKLKFVFHR